jgi:hypothetical protein
MTKSLSIQDVCARYSGICDRTVDRWVEAGVLPKPTYIRRRRYWDLAELGERDEARKSEAAKGRCNIPASKRPRSRPRKQIEPPSPQAA